MSQPEVSLRFDKRNDQECKCQTRERCEPEVLTTPRPMEDELLVEAQFLLTEVSHTHTHSFFQRLSLMSIVTCPHLMMCLTCNVFSVLHSEYLRRCPLNLQQYMDTLVVHLPASHRRSDNFPYIGTLPLTQSFLAGACCLVLQIRCKAMRLRLDGSVLVLSLLSHRVRGDCEARRTEVRRNSKTRSRKALCKVDGLGFQMDADKVDMTWKS